MADGCERRGRSAVGAVIVNRIWHHHFGRGLVDTPNDFGILGSQPSHRELLDWLAGQLIEGGWKLKPIHRLLLNSSVFGRPVPSSSATEKMRRIVCSSSFVRADWKRK